IVLSWSGALRQPIIYDGNSAGSFGTGRAIIDGMGHAKGPLADQFGFLGGESWNGVLDVGVSYVTIEHFEIRDQRYIWNDTGGGWNNGPQGVEIGGLGSNVTVQDCWIHDIQPIALAVNRNSEVMGSLNAWSSVHVTQISFNDSNISLAEYAGTAGSLARFKIYVGWGADDYTIASAYLGPYWATNNTLRVYQDLNLTMPGWNTANSDPVGQATQYGYSIFNMTQGPMYGKESSDVSVSDHTNLSIIHNTLSDAGTAIGLSLDNNSFVQGNDISNVSWGIAGGSGEIPAAAMVNITIASNQIHDFYPYVRNGYWSGWHGDGIYLFAGSDSYADIRNFLIEGNDFYGYIPESTALIYAEDADYENITIYDNIFAASGSWMIRISADAGSVLNEVRVFNNDFVMAPLDQSPAVLFQGGVTNVSLRNNIVWVPSGWGAVFSFDPSGLAPTGSDYNLLGSDYAYAGDVGYNDTEYTLAQWVGSAFPFPHDQHSLIDANPQFLNFPEFESYLSGGTANNLTFQIEDPRVNPHVNSTFRVGDRVEYDYDGIVRTVTAVGPGTPQPWVELTPALSVPPSAGDFLTDWGSDTNFTFDLHVAATSPVIGAGMNLAGQVPAIDADGAARPLTGAWDIGAFVFAPPPPVTVASVTIEPSAARLNVEQSQSFEAVAVCTQACPSGVRYSWSLTDGQGTLNSSTGSNVTFTARDTAGTDTLYLNTTLNDETVPSQPLVITIDAPVDLPEATQSHSPIQYAGQCTSPDWTTTFFGNSSGGTPPDSFAWNFGDGSPGSNLRNVSHTFVELRAFDVTLNVTDAAGNQATDVVSIVPALPPCAPRSSGPAVADYLSWEITAVAVGAVVVIVVYFRRLRRS
ncbi:MAG: PKD domain-containing protein, partial [Thermoplasmata archaeon]|nr:PKD domain-containing protein [Thermoplasmata archaeon]